MPLENRKICKGITKKGQSCGQIALKESDYCKVHDPNFKGRIGHPKKHGYYATVLQNEDELNDYLEALSMGHVESLTDMSALQMAKSKLIQRSDIDEQTKMELLLRYQEAARRSRESAANIESRSQIGDKIKAVSFLWEDEEAPDGKGESGADTVSTTEAPS